MREHLQPAEEWEHQNSWRRGLEKEDSSWEKLPVAGLECVTMQREMDADGQ